MAEQKKAPQKKAPQKAPQKAAQKAPQKRVAQKQTQSQTGPQGKGASVNQEAGTEDSASASKRLFDLRWLIAAMFVVYGIVLSITGLFDSQAELNKAAGVRINLWTGLGMFVVGLVFAAWARWRPLRPE